MNHAVCGVLDIPHFNRPQDFKRGGVALELLAVDQPFMAASNLAARQTDGWFSGLTTAILTGRRDDSWNRTIGNFKGQRINLTLLPS